MVRAIERTVAVLLGAGSVFVTSGCAGTDILWDADETDAVGVWIPAVDDAGAKTRLDVREDGTFSAVAWPRNLMCAGAPEGEPSPWSETVRDDDVDWGNTIDFDGEWYQGEDHYRLQMYAAEPCYGGGGPQIWARWWEPSPALELRFYPAGQDEEWNFVAFAKQSD